MMNSQKTSPPSSACSLLTGVTPHSLADPSPSIVSARATTRGVLTGYGLFWAVAERVKPPEGFVFERLPTIPLVVQITSSGQAFYQLNDQRLRELWILESRISAFTLGFILAVIFHGAQLIYLDRKSNKHQGNK